MLPPRVRERIDNRFRLKDHFLSVVYLHTFILCFWIVIVHFFIAFDLVRVQRILKFIQTVHADVYTVQHTQYIVLFFLLLIHSFTHLNKQRLLPWLFCVCGRVFNANETAKKYAHIIIKNQMNSRWRRKV